MITERIADVAVLIVGFRNPADLTGCLAALSDAAVEPNFDVFICENGGVRLVSTGTAGIARPAGPMSRTDEPTISHDEFQSVHRRPAPASPNETFKCVGRMRNRTTWDMPVGSMLGFINCSLSPVGKEFWVLNPDTEPEAYALAALVERAETGGKGMVGSTILDVERPNEIRCRGGLHWQRLAARAIAIGLGEPLNAPYDVSAIEAAMDSPSGASMYVTRQCLEKIGPMDESYFLFFEDLDWGLRAKSCGLGYASASIVWHKRGTTTGSAKSLAKIPRLSIYLEHRNGIHFVRRHFPWTLPVRVAISFLYAVRFLIHRAPENFMATLEGVLAGLRGEVGRPTKYHELAGNDLQGHLIGRHQTAYLDVPNLVCHV